jgi:selenide,water dikinase
LIEVCEGSGLSAELDYAHVPLIHNLKDYTSKMIYPDNTMRNWSSYQTKVDRIGGESLLTLCDPQTSGGLLVCVRPDQQKSFELILRSLSLPIHAIGRMITPSDKRVYVKEPI